ncbi:hypothetical protein ISF6_0153 [Piscinibacter sakaiensis]|uniref:Uncharacterized protein n=1 Tax=Piscinibacter sakaiensis TaxID=1547922 RepID=A0A0K8NTJ9_PISS1|nr:hypothetical protein ISF6_0153 [Piscinibacter sakaiensis]
MRPRASAGLDVYQAHQSLGDSPDRQLIEPPRHGRARR